MVKPDFGLDRRNIGEETKVIFHLCYLHLWKIAKTQIADFRSCPTKLRSPFKKTTIEAGSEGRPTTTDVLVGTFVKNWRFKRYISVLKRPSTMAEPKRPFLLLQLLHTAAVVVSPLSPLLRRQHLVSNVFFFFFFFSLTITTINTTRTWYCDTLF